MPISQLLIKICLILIAFAVAIWFLSTWAQGFSVWSTLGIVLATLATMLIFARIFRPLDHLARTSRDILDSAEKPIPTDSFELINKAFGARNKQLDKQSRKLGESREHFNAVLSGMADGVIAIDDQVNVLFANKVAREMLGLQTIDLVGKPLIGLVRFEAVEAIIREAIETQKTVSSEFRTHGTDRREIILRAAPMTGEPMPGMTLVFRDLTEINQLENMRREFVANVSHELKTPLASIKAYAETLLMGALNKPPENQKFVEQIESQADLLTQQVQDLLQIARIEAGRETIRQVSINLNQTCWECIDRFAREATTRDVELIFEPDDSIEFVDGDAEAIGTILDNLVSNAIRYTGDQGRVSLTTSIDDSFYQIEVADTGIGIPPENQHRVFERFYRVDKARSRDLGGTGLGLAIAKHLTESQNGRIELESKVGGGSKFRVFLPVTATTF